ncbi:ComEC/Rec2 family competence protein [Rhizobium wuzhouense]|uniref:ComEC/Rec2 family competence protein n=1 Tax=Rhizobium wuzhouense TaxID=1986026 RepID=UPI00197F9A6A|nr:ComEC/Rec2 family competence protein [Rhizobium wuzhouense]
MVHLRENNPDIEGEALRAPLGEFAPPLRTDHPVSRPTRSRVARLNERLRSLPAEIRIAAGKESGQGHLFHFVPVCIGLGEVVWFSLPVPPSTMSLLALLPLSLIALWFSLAGTNRRVLCLAALMVVAGMLLADAETRRMATIILDAPVVTTVTGVVERREAGAAGEWRYVIRLSATADPVLRRPPQRISLLARSRHGVVRIGDPITGRARLSPPSGPALPGMNDFAFQSYFAGIGAVGFFLGAPERPSIARAAESDLWTQVDQSLFSLRDRISDRIHEVLPGDTGAFAASIITGERRSMSKEATDALRLSGLAHITAISGLNMALAAGIFFVGLRALLSLFPGMAQRYPVKKIAAGGALLAATAYVLISGYQVSALRAYLMTAIMLVAVLIDRPAISLRNLAVAATIILITQPSAVMGPSFQMSFAATAALIAGYAAWRKAPRSIWPAPTSTYGKLATFAAKFVGGTLATSLIGGLSTAIFAVTHFHRLSTHGLEANLAAMPLISIIVMPAGFIAMLAMPFGLDAPFFWIMGGGLDLVLVVAHTVAGWGEAAFIPRQPTWFPVLVVVALLLMTLLHTGLRHGGTVLLVVTLAAAFLRSGEQPADLLVSEDGRMVGFWSQQERVGEGRVLASNRKRPPAFLFDQWQPALAAGHHLPPSMESAPVLPPPADWKKEETWDSATIQLARQTLEQLVKTAKTGRFICIRGACAAKLVDGWTVLTVDRLDLAGPACDVADIVILGARSRMKGCRSTATFLSETTLRASGAVEIRLGAHHDKTIEITPALSGPPRPWTIHRLYDWRTGETARQHGIDSGAMKDKDSDSETERKNGPHNPAMHVRQ